MKQLKLLFTVLFLSVLGLGNVWGYEIVFSTNSGDGTSASTSTKASDVVTSTSAAYVSGNLATATKAYYAGGSGLKLGTSSAAGTVKINLSATGQVNVTSVDVYAKCYNSSKQATIAVNSKTAQNAGASSFTKCSFAITGQVTYIELTANKYCWVEKVVLNEAGGSEQPTV